MSVDLDDVKRMQKNLVVIRKIAGWSADCLGKKIGVTKQTVRNLEIGKTTMTTTQCIAIRGVLDEAAAERPSDKLLPAVVKLLLDDKSFDNADDATRAEVGDAMQTLAAAASGGLPLPRLAALAGKLLGEDFSRQLAR